MDQSRVVTRDEFELDVLDRWETPQAIPPIDDFAIEEALDKCGF
jgi:hypothetical protein